MAKAKGGLYGLTTLGLLQYDQDLVTAATGNPNAPTPFPWIATLQAVYDTGVDKVNAVTAAEDNLAMLRAERDEHIAYARLTMANYIQAVEAICASDPVKLQSFGLALRSPASPPQPCGTVTGLKTSTGDDEGAMGLKWTRDLFADAYEIQISPDPITATSWTPVMNVSRAKAQLTGLPSGQKRWVRVRAFNAQGPGSWSDPSCRMVP
jgi:hypothetical protein